MVLLLLSGEHLFLSPRNNEGLHLFFSGRPRSRYSHS